MGKTIAGAILAGGKACRFGGISKGLLEISPGVTFIDRILGEMTGAGIREWAICANDTRAYARFQGAILPDLHPGGGPMSGIESALSYFKDRCDGVLFMPCDLPFVTRAQIVRLTETFQKGNSRVVVAQTDDFFWHPLCSVVHIDVLPLVEEEMAAGHFKIAPVWHKAGHTAVPFDSRRPFININSPRDYADYLSGETPAGTGK